MAKMNMNRLREIVAEASDLIADYDTRRAAESGDAPKPAAMDSASDSQHERDMVDHYKTMEAISPHASRIWKSRR